MSIANQAAFNDPRSRAMASGVDLRPSHAITDPSGNVLAYAQTGGILNPGRFELAVGSKIFRFGSRSRNVSRVLTAPWWLEQQAFEKLFSFAQVWELNIGMALRMLCLVPPEWSDASLLIRARVVRPLLAWRGLANSVVTPASDNRSMVRMPHQNEISERRVNQLFIPGLDAVAHDALQLEQEFHFDPDATKRGFIYL
jgi:hypothetical protein